MSDEGLVARDALVHIAPRKRDGAINTTQTTFISHRASPGSPGPSSTRPSPPRARRRPSHALATADAPSSSSASRTSSSRSTATLRPRSVVIVQFVFAVQPPPLPRSRPTLALPFTHSAPHVPPYSGRQDPSERLEVRPRLPLHQRLAQNAVASIVLVGVNRSHATSSSSRSIAHESRAFDALNQLWLTLRQSVRFRTW